MNWKILSSHEELELLHNLSFNTPNGIAIFKHSTRCSISSTAKSRLERNWSFNEENLPIYLLDLIAFRSVSSEISTKYNIEHQSPQLLLIKNGECIYHDSHFSISIEELSKSIKN